MTKRQLADVLIYISDQYGKSLSIEDVELGLLAASQEYGEQNGQDLRKVVEPRASEEPVEFLDQEPEEEEAVEMESAANDGSDWVTDDFVDTAPAPKPTKGKPGIKPDLDMLEAMMNGSSRLTPNDVHISTYELAMRFYDFIENDVAAPDGPDDDLSQKIKLAIGSTMKALGWRRRMRKGEWGWHPIEKDFFDTESRQLDPEEVKLRKRDVLIEDDPDEEVRPDIASSIPKLSDRETKSTDDEMQLVRFVNLADGTENQDYFSIVVGPNMTFFLDDNGIERMVEWDENESCWTYFIEDAEWHAKGLNAKWFPAQ